MAAPRGPTRHLRGAYTLYSYTIHIIKRGIPPSVTRKGIRTFSSVGPYKPDGFINLFRVGLKSHTIIFISGDVADGGASIGRSARDPRVDRVDADHRSFDRARGINMEVIAVQLKATWQHQTRRLGGRAVHRSKIKHVSLNTEL